MSRPNWIALLIAAVLLLLIVYFFGGTIGSWLWSILKTIGSILALIATELFSLLVSALHLALIPLSYVVAAVLVIATGILGIGAVVTLTIALARHIGGNLAALSKQIRELHVEFRLESKRTARDAAFLALIGTLCAVIAYMGTEEFLKQISTVQFLAICGMGLVVAKLLFFFPSRVAKGVGMLLTLFLLVGTATFVLVRYEFVRDPAKGLANLSNVFLDPENELKILLVGIVAILSLFAVLYPFRISEWRGLLATPERLPSVDTSPHADVRVARM